MKGDSYYCGAKQYYRIRENQSEVDLIQNEKEVSKHTWISKLELLFTYYNLRGKYLIGTNDLSVPINYKDQESVSL